MNFLFSTVGCNIAANGSGLCEGADFMHKRSIEEPNYKFSKKFHTKHLTRSLAKPLLPAGWLFEMYIFLGCYFINFFP